jgi:hypothetical protein
VAADHSKAPDVPGRLWNHFKERLPTDDEHREMAFELREGLGLVAGAISRLDCLDFDTNQVFEDAMLRAHASGLGALVDRLVAGYLDRTPGGGRRLLVYYPAGLDWKPIKLAQRPGRPELGEGPVKTLIELPAFAVIAPSHGRTHKTGRPYEHLSGDLTTIASYTADERRTLMDLWRSFDEMPAHAPSPPRQTTPRPPGSPELPGAAFARRMTWPELLEPAGWTHAYDRGEVSYWRRPGKDDEGKSASVNYGGTDRFRPFTTSTEFTAGEGYSKFGFYTQLHHGGDFSKAAAALRRLGYGDGQDDDPSMCLNCGRDACEGDCKEQPEPETGHSAGEPVPPRTAAPRRPRLGRWAHDIWDEGLPEETIEGLAWAQLVTMLVSESAVGKTFVMLDAAAAVSAGLSWHGRTTQEGTVAYCSWEGDAIGLRMRAMRVHCGHKFDHVCVIRMSEPISPMNRDGEAVSSGERLLLGELDMLQQDIITEHRPPLRLIVIDTVRASMTGKEDGSDATSAYVRVARRTVSAAPHAACVLIHHAGWQDGDAPKKRERGSSAWRGNVDATMYLEAGDYDEHTGTVPITLSALKVRDAERPADLRLIRRRVSLNEMDPRGQPVTSCVIDRDHRSREMMRAEKAAEIAKASATLDTVVLRAIRDHPAATSNNLLQPFVGQRAAVVRDAVARLLGNGLLIKGIRNHPFTITTAGLEVLNGG